MAQPASPNLVFEELLPLIFKSSVTSDLLNYRLVSRKWKQHATAVLMKRDCFKITFHLDLEQVTTKTNNPTFCLLKRQDDWCDEHAKIYGVLLTDFLRDKTLSDFYRLVTNSSPKIVPSLPVDNFDFCFKSLELNRNQPQLVSFVQWYGHTIRTLTLDNCVTYFVGQPGMPDFILQYTPNLESLHIAQSSHNNTEIPPEFPKNVPDFQLARLKTIKIEERPRGRSDAWASKDVDATAEILEHLLEIAPQLERVSYKSLPPQGMADIFLPDKVHLLHIDTFPFSGQDEDMSPESLDALEEFVDTMTKSSRGFYVRQLEVGSNSWHRDPGIWRRGSTALLKTVQANLNSLKGIQLADGGSAIMYKIPGIPALVNVTKLTVVFSWGWEPDVNDSNFLGNSLESLFPNLKTFEFIVWNWNEQDAAGGDRFPFWNNRLMTVKTLITSLNHSFRVIGNGSEAFAKCMELCPEVEKFGTRWPYCKFSLLLTPVYVHLTQITSLHLMLQLCNDLILNKPEIFETFVDLDAALTGLPEKTVIAIYNNWEDSGEWEMPKQDGTSKDQDDTKNRVSRMKSSILALKHLQQLKLEFLFDPYKTPQVAVSGVSAKFGFALMENLKVSIEFSFCKLGGCFSCLLQKAKPGWLKLHEPLLKFPNVTLG